MIFAIMDYDTEESFGKSLFGLFDLGLIQAYVWVL